MAFFPFVAPFVPVAGSARTAFHLGFGSSPHVCQDLSLLMAISAAGSVVHFFGYHSLCDHYVRIYFRVLMKQIDRASFDVVVPPLKECPIVFFVVSPVQFFPSSPSHIHPLFLPMM